MKLRLDRTRLSLPALSFSLVLAGCANFSDLDSDREATESSSAAIAGGSVVDSQAFPATAKLAVVRPNDEQGEPQNPLDCSGVLIAPTLVLTSAVCVDDNVDGDGNLVAGGTVTIGFGSDGAQPGGGLTATAIELHRYYDPDSNTAAQLAIVSFVGDVSGIAEPVVLNDSAADLEGYSGMVTLVGFGKDGDGGVIGVRRSVDLAVGLVSAEFFSNGTDTATSCEGDSGGPVFADFGEGTVLVGITQFQGSCRPGHLRTRVDVHTADFLFPYVDRFSGPCPVDGTCTEDGCRTPDPDCPENTCQWGNACDPDCDTRDWDCDIGSFGGDDCTVSGDCERNGACVSAVDDADFLYCTQECDSSSMVSQCPTSMTCESDQCVFGNPSPGSQGFSCVVGDECRSGICEDLICVNECTLGGNDCPGDFTCGPSKVSPGANVCLGVDRAGGGGFCATGGGSAPIGALLLLALVLVPAAMRRRRQRA